MKINVSEGINEYYLQTLAMLFFPGAKFPEKNEDPDNSELTVSCVKEGTAYTAYARMTDENGAFAEATETLDGSLYGGRDGTCVKMAVGRAVFAAGKKLFGQQPPWGVLTGVRPAKVAADLIAANNGVTKTRQILKSEYFLSQKKAALLVSVAGAELAIKKKLTPDMCSVYISIPFCPSRCAYCSFVSYTTKRLLSMQDEYLDCLIVELKAIFDHIKAAGKKVATVYIGGGTPTILDEAQLDRLLTAVSSCCDTSSLMEFTLEGGRPDTFTEEKLRIAKDHGVTRISVNPQTLSESVLQAIGRKHTVDDFFRAYDMARSSGIRTINVDVIAGLPADNFTRFSRTIDKITELAPQNITVHSFCVKRSSDFLRTTPDIYHRFAADAVRCVDYSQLKLRNSGYRPYYLYRQKNTVGNMENVGFSMEGYEGLYNVIMMEEYHTVYAAGAGGVTRLVDRSGEKIMRFANPKYPYEYLSGGRSYDSFLERLEKEDAEIDASDSVKYT